MLSINDEKITKILQINHIRCIEVGKKKYNANHSDAQHSR